MKIFPAIDIKDKKCVRLIKGDFENKTEYEISPIDQAGKYKDHGFKNLHIVDLDGALTGKTVNLDIIKEIVSKYDLKIEIGGGVRSLDSIKQYIDTGVEKVILGSGAIKNKEFLKESCEKFKGQIALGLDAKDGNLSVSGWKENLNVKTTDFLKEVSNYGVSRIIYTDINRDGMKTSPNLDETVKIAELSNCPVVISGGVSKGYNTPWYDPYTHTYVFQNFGNGTGFGHFKMIFDYQNKIFKGYKAMVDNKISQTLLNDDFDFNVQDYTKIELISQVLPSRFPYTAWHAHISQQQAHYQILQFSLYLGLKHWQFFQ